MVPAEEGGGGDGGDGLSRVEERSEVELGSFSTDDASARVVDVMTGIDTDGLEDADETTDSELDDHEFITETNIHEIVSDANDEGGSDQFDPHPHHHEPPVPRTRSSGPC